eukprot:CAMPEP_0174730326 /NCGR_PEP_ID=MMETSP1094-20130205/55358_1 /TAXON_ID=156173 /ORGANISM="Chrysochromulina brevifilum, Strain UTEX LB 985" /LENGTH=41 /DNA_ID= /DNA_START= /DNA_END= /DNA_ORIENTATION=
MHSAEKLSSWQRLTRSARCVAAEGVKPRDLAPRGVQSRPAR